ncbi:unnamed protein product [Prorocentrum cordatum]|uniref:protein-tyrosine-phosphatase n=1 Tax=Prorocentrum cordatum TaxID=2364126 RepID=A0ABN9TAA9_9DINO|nr:unnamed protein product [Polarella glacialis]
MTDGEGVGAEQRPPEERAADAEQAKGGAAAAEEAAAEAQQAGAGGGAVANEGDADRKEKKSKKEKKEKKPTKSAKMGFIQDEEFDWIWIGDAEDARDAVALKKNNVRYILNCTPPRTQGGVMNFHDKDPSFEYCRLSMGDNSTEQLASRFQASWDFFEKARIREDGGVLVHCQQGVSRSVSMVVAYLMKHYRKDFDVALSLAKSARAQACPNEGFTAQLKALDEELRSGKQAYEKVPPKRARLQNPSMVGPSLGPTVAAGPSRGPVGPGARGPPGPARGPVGPQGPQRGPPGPAGPPPGAVGGLRGGRWGPRSRQWGRRGRRGPRSPRRGSGRRSGRPQWWAPPGPPRGRRRPRRQAPPGPRAHRSRRRRRRWT